MVDFGSDGDQHRRDGGAPIPDVARRVEDRGETGCARRAAVQLMSQGAAAPQD